MYIFSFLFLGGYEINIISAGNLKNIYEISKKKFNRDTSIGDNILNKIKDKDEFNNNDNTNNDDINIDHDIKYVRNPSRRIQHEESLIKPFVVVLWKGTIYICMDIYLHMYEYMYIYKYIYVCIFIYINT
jgi:hypothetical protein